MSSGQANISYTSYIPYLLCVCILKRDLIWSNVFYSEACLKETTPSRQNVVFQDRWSLKTCLFYMIRKRMDIIKVLLQMRRYFKREISIDQHRNIMFGISIWDERSNFVYRYMDFFLNSNLPGNANIFLLINIFFNFLAICIPKIINSPYLPTDKIFADLRSCACNESNFM